MRILEFMVTAIYSFLNDILEAFEESETPKITELYSATKKKVCEPAEKVWEQFKNWISSTWAFLDSIIGGVTIPLIDSSIANAKEFSVFGLKQSLELGYQLDIAIIAVIAPFINIIKTIPIIGELVVAIEFCLKYILVDYLELDYEEESLGEGPMAFTKEGKPAGISPIRRMSSASNRITDNKVTATSATS